MEVIGTKRAKVKDTSVLQPLVIEGRPQEFPIKPGHAVIFGYDRVFGSRRKEEALILCRSLEDMQACYDRMHGKTRIAWYLAEVPDEPALESRPIDEDEVDIRDDFPDAV